MHFYTNVTRRGNNILVRGFRDGVPYKEKVPYKPYVFIPSKEGTSEFHSLDGVPLEKKVFESLNDRSSFMERYDDVGSMEIYQHHTNVVYSYIYDTFKNIEYDPSLIRVLNIDIEVDSSVKIDVESANQPIITTTIKCGNVIYAFGMGEYTPKQSNITYKKCRNERDLLAQILKVWIELDPDVITGWYVNGFDIPYLFRRMKVVLGEEYARRLSPWGKIYEKSFKKFGKDQSEVIIEGVTILDYIDLYKKFTYSQQESYKLDYICMVELGEQKVDYSEYGTLDALYKNNFELFMDYNIKDVLLVDRLDQKMKLIELAYAIAYMIQINYEDVFTSVRLWEVKCNNYLMDRNIVPPLRKASKEQVLVGAYVKEPKLGMSKWVASFDLTSLYPSLIMMYNMSPETFIDRLSGGHDIQDILNGSLSEYHDSIVSNDHAITANLCLFDKTKRGFLPILMENMFNDRVKYKNLMIASKKDFERTKDKSFELSVAMYNNFQMALKIALNSLYGALANKYFLYHDHNIAESITMSGQLSIQWAEKAINEILNKLAKTEGVDYVIASDTDSLYISLEAIVERVYPNYTKNDTKKIIKFLEKVCREKLQKVIDDAYAKLHDYMNAYEQKMHMKLECIGDKAIWQRKKRYILNVYHQEGVDYDEPVLKIMGLEAVRSSTPYVCREKMKETIKVIINEDEEATQSFIKKFRDEFNTMSFEDVASPTGVDGVEKYNDNGVPRKGSPIHVRASIVYNNAIKKMGLTNKYDEIVDQDKIKFSYLIEPNPFKSNVIACRDVMPKEFEIDQYIDYDKQFETTFLKPITSILSVIGWNAEETSTLESFFG